MTQLQACDLKASYGDFQALYGINLVLNQGEMLAIIGANGAGKTSLLRALSGTLPAQGRDITLHGRPIGHLPAHEIVALGIAMIPEGRRLFPSLDVEENLLMGAYVGRPGPWSLRSVYRLFPDLMAFRKTPATQLSGGQQQMVAIGRALMSNPEILLCDEVSLGLAPVIVRRVYQAFPEIRRQGVSIILVEQDIRQALSSADRMMCLCEGRVVLQGKAQAFGQEEISRAYFGVDR
ncbi:ABC transporter ATP-binding protein [Castellaniella defragrans]|uniref:ABC transporter ATP-binding protein n=1 Tax=Castellaniella defragrans TaxID=75697 RepID=UPI002AFFAC5A|nr:ABC transporter ATP-binding protein [Castellaniella defragrans]